MDFSMTARDGSFPLMEKLDRQEDVFASAFSILQEAIAERAFPAASVAVTLKGGLVALKAFGHFTYTSTSPAVAPATLFDLGSVTKVVATTSMAMLLYERGLLDLDAPLAAIVP
jgi:CubicO group peptidase (beta-lactamase class C family)